MTGLVWTDFGAHIIMYTRHLPDFIFTNTLATLNRDIAKYFSRQTLTSYGTRTFFDLSLERITRPAFNRFEQQLLGDWKSENTITIYRRVFRHLT